MKLLPLFAAIAAAFLLAGCEDLADSIRGDSLPGEGAPLVRTFPAAPRATFAAARAALGPMGFRFTHGGPAQGEMRAVSEVSAGDAPGSTHQFTLKAEFHPAIDGTGTQVSLRMTEIIEADSTNHPGQGTETPLRDTALPEVFLRGIQEQLAAPAAK